jgi:hypothetical protein
MKLVLGVAHWTGGGIAQYLDMELGEFFEWAQILEELAK